MQNISTEWRRFSDQENKQYMYKEKAHLKLATFEKETKKTSDSREQTKENQRREKLPEKAYETFFTIRSQ